MNLLEATQHMTEVDLINRILLGEEHLYEVIIRRHNPYLYKIGRSYGYTHDDVEDLMQDTYINVYSHLNSFEGRSSFKTWIVRIMLNQCYQKKQKLGFGLETSIPEDTNDEYYSTHHYISDGNKTVQNMELKAIIEQALLNIPEDYRMVFTLRQMNGLSVRETSELLNISEANVKVRLNRAKAMLQEEVKKIFSLEEIFEFNLIYCDAMVNRVMQAIKDVAIL